MRNDELAKTVRDEQAREKVREISQTCREPCGTC